MYEQSESMSILELAENLRIIDGPKEALHPKNVGLLFFSYNPEKYLLYSYIELTIIYDPTGEGMKEQTFKGPLNIQYRDAMQFIKNNIIQEKVFKIPVQMEARRYFNYPYEAIEEILGNAILHKNYQIPEPISIRITKTEIEITSLPGIDSSITDKDIKLFKLCSRKYRNRRISEFLKELHIAEAKNTGIPTVLKYLNINDSPLPIIEMDSERTYVTVKLPIHEKFLEDLTRAVPANKRDIDKEIILALKCKTYILSSLSKQLGYKSISGSLKNIENH